MNKRNFIEAGYKEFPVGIERDWADCAMQKVVKDPAGIKYFISVYMGKFSGEPTSKVQVETNFGVLNLELWKYDSIESMEQFFSDAWSKLGFKYYEEV